MRDRPARSSAFGVAALSKEEQNVLFARAKEGDKRARERLILSMHGLVHHLAKSLWKQGGEVTEELVQAGHIGLLEALDRFDPDRDVKISSYASHYMLMRMRQAKQRLLSSQSEPGRWNPAEDRARKLVQKGVTHPDALAAQSGMTPYGAMRFLQMLGGGDVPIDAPRGELDGSLHDVLASGEDVEESILEEDEARDARERIAAALRELSPREREILQKRWLQSDEDDCQTLLLLAGSMQLSRERIRQIEEELFRKLRILLGAERAGKQTPDRDRHEARPRPPQPKRRVIADPLASPGFVPLQAAADRLRVDRSVLFLRHTEGTLPTVVRNGRLFLASTVLSAELRRAGLPQYHIELRKDLLVRIDARQDLSRADVSTLVQRLTWLVDGEEAHAVAPRAPPGYLTADTLAARLGTRPQHLAKHVVGVPSLRAESTVLYDPRPVFQRRRAEDLPSYHVRVPKRGIVRLWTDRDLDVDDVEALEDAILLHVPPPA